jgi:hypothetical protein
MPVKLFTLPLANGRELEVSREPAPCRAEWLRLAIFRRYGADRMPEGCERGEPALLALALDTGRP